MKRANLRSSRFNYVETSRYSSSNIFLKNCGFNKKGSTIHLMGYGGVGTNLYNVIRDFPAYHAEMTRIEIYDFDHVELHNLNRTSMFLTEDVINQKSKLQTSVIGGDCFVPNYRENRDLVIDCRDTLNPEIIHEKTWVKLAYNGGNAISFHFKPQDYVRFLLQTGEQSAYEVTPSFYVPASLLANLTLFFMSYSKLVRVANPCEVQFDIDSEMENASFDINSILG